MIVKFLVAKIQHAVRLLRYIKYTFRKVFANGPHFSQSRREGNSE